MRSTDRRYIQSAPLFVLLLACVAGKGSATGTTPQFTLQNAKGLRGGVARVPLDVSNGVGDTKAINFTIKILEGENLVDGLLKGSSELDGFEENSPSQTEYRAIIDPPSSTFSTLSSRRIATIEVPIKANPSGNTIMLEVVTKFDQDGIVGLTGMSDLNGNSVHGPDETPAPNGPRAILGNSATITLPDQSVGFCDSSLSPDWEFSRVLPVTPTVTPTPTPCLEGAPTQQGYGVTLKAKNTFGFLQTKDTDATVIPSPGDGKILHVLWTIGSNSALAYDLPTFRLRTSARDASFTQEHIFQEGSAANNAPIVMPVTGDGAPRNFESVYYCPTSLTNDLPNVSSNGIILAFDVLQFEEGTNGVPESRLYLMNVVYSTIDPTPLGNGTLVLDLDFSAGEQHDFTPIEFNPSTAPPPTPIPDPVHHCEYKGILPSKLTVTGSPEESGGLNIELLSPKVQSPSLCGNASGVDFAYGIWEKTFSGSGTNESWEVAADSLYRVDFTLSSTAQSGTTSHTARLRFTVGDNDFTGTAIVNGVNDKGFDPRGGDKLYTAYVKFPPATVGLPVKVSYEVYCASPVTGGTITLRNLKVTKLNLTSADQFGSACPTPSP